MFNKLKKKIKANVKGVIGEAKVSIKANVILSSSKYTIFDNVYIQGNEKVAQLDHIMVSDYGIFVIETKNYAGNIYGDETKKNFIQYLGSQKNYFYNPIKQNATHIRVLKEVVGDYPFYSIIVFSDECTLKVNSTTPVIYKKDLIRTIKNYNSVCISKEEKDKIISLIYKAKIVDRKIIKNHIDSIKSYQKWL